MDTFLRYITAHNAPAWRDEIFAVLPGPDSARAEWSLEREEDLERIRLWIREAVRPTSDLAQLYRKLELDLEDDIVRSFPAFEKTPCFGPLEAHYSLRMLWRVLLRRYAIRKAREVDGPLAPYETGGFWRYWRIKDVYFPRLLVGVLLGFFTLGSSSGIVDTIYRMRCHCWWPLAPAVCVAGVFLLAFADVQRQVGRLSPPEIASRAGRVLIFGALFAVLGGAVQWLRAVALAYGVDRYGAIATMCAGVALLLGFVFQLFWQDRSIGEPL